MQIVVSCEHAKNDVPKEYAQVITGHTSLLPTHRGYDIGVEFVARRLAKRLQAPFVSFPVSRLLIDPNRSVSSTSLFVLPLAAQIKNELLMRYYFPYRDRLQHALEYAFPVLHLSLHSFTPELFGKERKADIGLLYDPARKREKKLCAEMREQLRAEHRVRLNYPYQGRSDGLTTYFRKCYGELKYLGVEIEINQKLLGHKNVEIVNELVEAIRTVVW